MLRKKNATKKCDQNIAPCVLPYRRKRRRTLGNRFYLSVKLSKIWFHKQFLFYIIPKFRLVPSQSENYSFSFCLGVNRNFYLIRNKKKIFMRWHFVEFDRTLLPIPPRELWSIYTGWFDAFRNRLLEHIFLEPIQIFIFWNNAGRL